jgi:perosamine synthetase
MTNVQAALGLAQMEYWDEHIARKKQIGKIYQQGLAGLPGLKLPLARCDYAENLYWVFGLVAESEEGSVAITEYLHGQGIGTRPFFWCMHEQPVFVDQGLFQQEKYTVAERLARNGFYLPSGLGVTDEEIGVVINKMSALA